MAEPLNTTPAGYLPTATLIADSVQTTGGSPDSIPTLTQVNGLPVAAAVEIQSTQGAALFPRLTTTERNALSSSTTDICNGMAIYNSTTDKFEFRQGNSWSNLIGNPITIPGTTTNNAVVRWSGTTGAAVKNSGTIIDDADNITGSQSITLGTASTTTGSLVLYNASNNASLTLQGVAGSDITWKLPTQDAGANSPLVTDGAGQLLFSSNLNLGVGGSVNGHIDFFNDTTPDALTLQSGVTSTGYTLTLPTFIFQPVNPGNSEYVPLASDASGALSFNVLGISYTRGTINAASILGMRATPVVLLQAPGANQAIIIHNFALELVYGTTPFTLGGNVFLIYGGTNTNFATSSTAIANTFVGGSQNQFIETPGFINSTSGLTNTSIANQSIRITNGTQGFASGDGSLVYHIWYSVVATD